MLVNLEEIHFIALKTDGLFFPNLASDRQQLFILAVAGMSEGFYYSSLQVYRVSSTS